MRVGSALRSTEIKPVAPRFVSWNQSDGLFKSLDVFFFLHSNQPVGVGVQAAARSKRAGAGEARRHAQAKHTANNRPKQRTQAHTSEAPSSLAQLFECLNSSLAVQGNLPRVCSHHLPLCTEWRTVAHSGAVAPSSSHTYGPRCRHTPSPSHTRSHTYIHTDHAVATRRHGHGHTHTHTGHAVATRSHTGHTHTRAHTHSRT